jgi:hypothetical protein
VCVCVCVCVCVNTLNAVDIGRDVFALMMLVCCS